MTYRFPYLHYSKCIRPLLHTLPHVIYKFAYLNYTWGLWHADVMYQSAILYLKEAWNSLLFSVVLFHRTSTSQCGMAGHIYIKLKKFLKTGYLIPYFAMGLRDLLLDIHANWNSLENEFDCLRITFRGMKEHSRPCMAPCQSKAALPINIYVTIRKNLRTAFSPFLPVIPFLVKRGALGVLSLEFISGWRPLYINFHSQATIYSQSWD